MSMTPFAIKLDFATPLVLSQTRQTTALCLDAVLAGLRRARGLDPLDLPLKQSLGLWHASAAFMRCGDDRFKRSVSFSRSVDTSLQQHDRCMRNRWNRNLNSDYILVGNSSGQFKLLKNDYDRMAVSHLHWWGDGDVEAIRELMSLLVLDTSGGRLPGYGLGRHANAGYGEVAKVAIAATSQDRSFAIGNRPMRPVPVPVWQALGHELDAKVMVASCAWQYPYYRTEKTPCAVPPTQVIAGRVADFINP